MQQISDDVMLKMHNKANKYDRKKKIQLFCGIWKAIKDCKGKSRCLQLISQIKKNFSVDTSKILLQILNKATFLFFICFISHP